MAGADYFPCSNCGRKTFYDAKLNYDFDVNPDTGLQGTAKILVLCHECFASNDIRIVSRKKVLKCRK